MVREYRALPGATTSRMNDRLRFELVALFGCYRVNMAETLDVVDMNLTAATMDAVQTAAPLRQQKRMRPSSPTSPLALAGR